jgi:predicted DNA-binding transcriptional regulator YafY
MPIDNILTTLRQAINNNKSIEINYLNNKGEQTLRILSQIIFSGQYNKESHIKAFCHFRNEERTFSVNNITGIKILDYAPAIPEKNIHENLSENYILNILNTAKQKNTGCQRGKGQRS